MTTMTKAPKSKETVPYCFDSPTNAASAEKAANKLLESLGIKATVYATKRTVYAPKNVSLRVDSTLREHGGTPHYAKQ